MGREPRVTTGTMSLEQFNRMMGINKKDPLKSFEDNDSGSLIDTLMRKENYSVIREYMEDRMGMTERNYDKREIVDAYINNMRKFNFGQSITTLEELAHLNKGDGKDLEARRRKAGNAYKLFDSLGGAFSKDRTLGEKVDAVYDYGRALIWDPVNVLSFGVGKFAAAGATKAATEIAKKAALDVAETMAKESIKKSSKGILTKKAKQEITEKAQKKFMEKVIEEGSYKNARKKAFKLEMLGATASDTIAAGGINVAEQNARMLSDVQDEYDPIAGMFSLAGGITGGGLGYILERSRNVDRLPLLSQLIDNSARLTLAARREALDINKAKSTLKNNEEFKKGLADLKNHSTRWAEQVKDGLDLRLANGEIETESEYSGLFDYELVKYFYFGGEDGTGLSGVLQRAGVPAWSPREKGDTFNRYLKDVYGVLDKNTKKEIQTIYDNVFNKFDNTFKGLDVDDYFDKFASVTSDAGRLLSLSKHLNLLSQVTGRPIGDLTNEQAVKLIAGEAAVSGTREKVKEVTETVQQNLIKFIVTHPGTTALNIKGWVQASSMQSYSDMIRAALYGGYSLVSGADTSAAYRRKAHLMLSLQKQKMENLLDPYMTYESAMDILVHRPKARKELFRYLTGGIDDKNAEPKGIEDFLEEMGVLGNQTLDRTQFEKLTNMVQTAYGVKAQDFLSKTQEYMYSLDKQIRLKYNMSLKDFMEQDNVWEFVGEGRGTAFQEFLEIETNAVKEAQRNTFSKTYSDQAGVVGAVAKTIEDMRKYPIVGAMMPFGQFFNNTIAFMADHSWVSLAWKGVAGTDRDLMDLITKGAAGWTVGGYLVHRELKNMEEDLAWDEERASDGTVISRKYDFPYSHLKLLGRIGAHMAGGDEVPADLIEEFSRTAGPEALTRSVGDAATSFSNMIGNAIALEGGEAKKEFARLLGDSVAMYTSGFTRFADPANQLIAVARGEDYKVIDRNQGSRTLNNSLRYVDQFFATLTGDDLAPEKESATSETAGSASMGKVFGYRSVDAPTTVEKLFNDVERPEWKTGIQGTPESVNVFKRYMSPILEMYADRVIENGWDELSMKDKKKTLSNILTATKKDVKEVLKASSQDEPKKAGLIQDIMSKGSSSKDRREILSYFGTSEDALWKLDVPQLSLILSFMEDEGVRNRALKNRMLSR